jgi:hypothetical protein
MSRVVAVPNASRGPASGRLTPGVARSLGSDGSDGDRNATPGVSPFRYRNSNRQPDPVPANATPGVGPFSLGRDAPPLSLGRGCPNGAGEGSRALRRLLRPRAWLLLLFPALAIAASPPAGLAELRRVERYAGDVAEAAQALEATAAEVHQAGRLQSLQRLRDRLGDLDRSILDLERAIAALDGALVVEE